ncbi:MAG: O-antigen ligase family protein [Novosphingobium sp.]|nr:O-antigen ligase family protein [Novosphingobium sp.]
MMAAYAMLTMQPEHWHRYKAVWLLLGAVLALTLLHLVPLPPQIWKLLPGRDIIFDIDEMAGLDNLWRPLSMAPESTINAAYSLAVPITVALLAAQLDEAGHKRMLITVIVLAIISGAFSLAQLAGANWHSYQRATQAAGLFVNRNHQAVLLAMIVPIATVCAALHAGKGISAKVVKIASIAIAIVVVPVVVMTESRAGVIVGAVALASVPLFWPRRPQPSQESALRRALLRGAWLLAILVVGAFWYAIVAMRDTSFSRFVNFGGDGRLPIWSSTFDMLGHYLPWGSGIGSYARVYLILEPSDLLEPQFTNHAHNEWLEIALTAGVPGLLIVVAAALLLGVAIWHNFRSLTVPNLYNRIGLVGIFMLAIASSSDYPVRAPIHAAMLALFAIWATPGRKSGDGVAVN